jgi:hypothetical protein
MATFAVFQSTALLKNDAGAVVVAPGAEIEVRKELVGLPLAALKADHDGLAGLVNPFNADADGYFAFYVEGGFYQITVTSADATQSKVYHDVAIGLNAGSDTVALTVEREVNDAGVIVLTAGDADTILVNKTVAAASRVVLPNSAERGSRKIRVADRKYDAATNNITLVPERPDVVTISIATPGVVSLVAHGGAANDPVSLETTGALPTGLAADTQYYIKTVLTPDTFTLSATPGGAAIATTGGQSGVHTIGFETIMGAASYVIDGNGGSIQLEPLEDGSGWL